MKPMSAVTSPSKLQRAQGAASITFKRRGPATVLDRLHQQGCAKIRLPKVYDVSCPQAVILNTSGGLTGGDVFELNCHWAEHTKAAMSTQAAERIYKSAGGTAKITNHLTIQTGACAHWLPQETILFDGGHVDRQFDVELTGNAQLVAVESWMIGRHAMGENVNQGRIRDHWRIRHDGRLIFADCLLLDGDIHERLCRPAIAQGQRCFAFMVIIMPELLELQARLRADGIVCSILDRLLLVRFMSHDIASMRQRLMDSLQALNIGVPRVWNC